ncbi:MAG: 1-acyl-sn-glycerol-3-phosphate acyltransferase [Desulfobacca sp.]|uniref:1-acyl-sn-glycerol-3-phosphate acyltransferase n=1 Tax=Desulfobacca sp. TaxID=2067990 RepID=UPI004049083D
MEAPTPQADRPQSRWQRIKNWCSGIFSGRDYHYYGYLPSRPSLLLRYTLDKLFTRVNIAPRHLQELQRLREEGIVVYAIKYRSHLDFLFFNRRYRQTGAPPPEFAFDLSLWMWQPLSHLIQIISASINYFTRNRQWPNPYIDNYFQWILNQRTAGFLFLVDEVGFRQRFFRPKEDPIRHLLEIQRQQQLPIFLVPQMVMEKDPAREDKGLLQLFFGDSENPGRLRKLALFFFRGAKAVVEVAEPLNLQEVLADPANEQYSLEEVAQHVRRELISRIDLTRRIISGPVVKSMEEFMELTLTDPALNDFMAHLAEMENQKIAKIKKQAQSYFLEIASDYNALLTHLADKTLTWVWQNIFDGISSDEAGFERIRRASPHGTLIYVPCHKSHIDYLILNYIIYQNNLQMPRIAAGKNLAFWPVGTIFRKLGAFFIRRRFHGAKLYAEVFATYLKTLIKEGYNIEFFIEGGRSRTGKLVLPQLGLLNMIVRAYQEGVTPDLIFVPSFIGYDQVMEEKAYLTELKGSQKKAESWRQLFHLRQLLKKRYGRVYLRFSEPISLNAYLRQRQIEDRNFPEEERRLICRDLAFAIIQRINEVSVVTPFALVCAALLTYPRKGVYRIELFEIIQVFYDYLQNRQAQLAETLTHLMPAVEEALHLCEARKLITPIEKEEELKGELGLGAYTIDESKRLILEYYKDNIIHFFIPASLTAMSILATQGVEFTGAQVSADYRFLKELFKYEFVYDDLGSEANVSRMLQYFSRRGVIGVIDRDADTYLLSASGLKELSYFANLLHNYLESYWITLRAIKYLKKRPRNERDFLKRIHSIGNKLHKVGEVERSEALSDANFRNALKLFGEKGVIVKKVKEGKQQSTFSRPEDADARDFYGQQLARFLRR